MEKIVPNFLAEKIRMQYNEEEANLILDGLLKEKRSSFRVNRLKSNYQEICDTLKLNSIKLDSNGEHCCLNSLFEDIFIIDKSYEETIRHLDIYSEGKIYFQNLSAMLPVVILDPKEKENILDMCSAPRWKNSSNCKYNE